MLRGPKSPSPGRIVSKWSNSMLTMTTQLEQPAVDFAADALGAAGWVLGKHGS